MNVVESSTMCGGFCASIISAENINKDEKQSTFLVGPKIN